MLVHPVLIAALVADLVITIILLAFYSTSRRCGKRRRLVTTIFLLAFYSNSQWDSGTRYLVITIILVAFYSQLGAGQLVRRLVITIILVAFYSPSKTMGSQPKGWYSSGTCETRSILSRASPLPVISAFSFPREVLQCFRPTPPLWRLATDFS